MTDESLPDLDPWSEHEGTVAAIVPWGLSVRLSSGAELFVRETHVGGVPPVVGSRVTVALVPNQAGALEPSLLGTSLRAAAQARAAAEMDDDAETPAEVELDGQEIASERDLHRVLAARLQLGPYYGANAAALRDSLTGNVGRPVRILWRHSATSKTRMGESAFERVVEVMRQVAADEAHLDAARRFELVLD